MSEPIDQRMDQAGPEADLAHHWNLDPDLTFLNHGSFGACPRTVLEAQQRIRDRMERDPVHFFKRECEPLLDKAVKELAGFLDCDPARLAFVQNTTTGVNTVLRSLKFRPGDELLVTTHAYNACRNALEFAAERAGARVIAAPVPFPLESPDQIVKAVMDSVTPRTRLALIDHITSSTGLLFPIARLVEGLNGSGVETLVDGAHAPGMVPLHLGGLGATYYVGNCHKWLCAPKGSAFLYVSPDRVSDLHPLTISHGANSPRTDRSRFKLEFDWTGTADVSAYLAVPEAIRFVGSLVPGGWPVVGERNHRLVVEARRRICKEMGLPSPCPDDMLGSLASIPLPDAPGGSPGQSWESDPLQEILYTRFRIQVPVTWWPSPPKRLLRISAHLYNNPSHYASLSQALKASL